MSPLKQALTDLCGPGAGHPPRDFRLVLSDFGLVPNTYIPSTPKCNRQVAAAVLAAASEGYVLTDREGRIVGKLVPA